MKNTPLNRRIAVVTMAVLLAGCGGSQPPVRAPDATQSPAIATRASRVGSWMARDAGLKNLLYVVVPTVGDEQGVVDAYSYPQATLEGQITDVAYPDGDCTDATGDVYVTDYAPSKNSIVEFAHGKTHPMHSLSVPGMNAVSCAVDSTTGDLAVLSEGNAQGQGGNVAIFRHAKGRPQTYTDSDIRNYEYCGYDNAGDLFVDGTYSGGYNLPKVAELPHGATSLVTINLNYEPNWISGIQWDGKYVAIGQAVKPYIFRYKIVGRNGVMVGATPLNDATNAFQFVFTGRRVIVTNYYFYGYIYRWDVLIYHYPAGGYSQTFIEPPSTILTSVALSRRR